jgi:hypothetical protein
MLPGVVVSKIRFGDQDLKMKEGFKLKIPIFISFLFKFCSIHFANVIQQQMLLKWKQYKEVAKVKKKLD